jgi:hypothetical protein
VVRDSFVRRLLVEGVFVSLLGKISIVSCVFRVVAIVSSVSPVTFVVLFRA